LLIAVGAVLVYLPGMDAGFYFDDERNILEVPALHWSEWSIAGVRGIFDEVPHAGRFVANLSFALNHLFSGLHPASYHWTNLGIHLAVGASLAWVTFLLTSAGLQNGARRRWALFSSVLMTALFLLHPLNVQAVTYVVQRMTSLATLFVLLSFGLYLSARDNRHETYRVWLFSGSVLCWLLALGSKEIALALPAVLLLYELSFHRHAWRQYIAVSRCGDHPAWCSAVALLGGVLLIFALTEIYDRPGLLTWGAMLPGRDFSGYQRVLTEARVQIFYLGLLFWPEPARLNLDHEFAYSVSLFDPWTTVVAVAAWLLGVLATIWLVVHKPRYGFPLSAYLLLHVLESGPINLELVFEHRMYLPMAALAILAANLLTDLPRKLWLPAVAMSVLVAITLAMGTYKRNQTWADPIGFLYDCANKSPGKFRPQYNLGTELGKHGRYVEAETVLVRALRIRPEDSQVHNQLGNVFLLTRRREQALNEYRAAVHSNPRNAEKLKLHSAPSR
jgi:hypothetical protein